MPDAALRPATRRDLPGLWDVRYAVSENTLTPGRISDEELLRAIESEGHVWALFVRPEAEWLVAVGLVPDCNQTNRARSG